MNKILGKKGKWEKEEEKIVLKYLCDEKIVIKKLGMKLINQNSDKTPQPKLLHNLQTQNVMKLKTQIVTKLKNQIWRKPTN